MMAYHRWSLSGTIYSHPRNLHCGVPKSATCDTIVSSVVSGSEIPLVVTYYHLKDIALDLKK